MTTATRTPGPASCSPSWPGDAPAATRAAFEPTPAPEVATQCWRVAWRDKVAPKVSTPALVALRDALAADNPRLVHGDTVIPRLPLGCDDFPADGGCAMGYCGIVECGGFGVATVAAVDEYFAARAVVGVGAFTDWFDSTPRPLVRSLLCGEVDRELRRRVGTEGA